MRYSRPEAVISLKKTGSNVSQHVQKTSKYPLYEAPIAENLLSHVQKK